HTAAPEFLQFYLVAVVIPFATAMPSPFVVGAHQWFMVRSADDDAIFIGGFYVERIVIVKCVAPHGRPDIISFETEDKFENLFIKEMVEAAECGAAPARQGRRFIINKYATVFYP